MRRDAVGIALLGLFAVVVIGVAASAIGSTPIQSGFGVGGDATDGGERVDRTGNRSSNPSPGAVGGGGGGGFGGSFSSGNAGSTGSNAVPPLVVLVAVAGVAVAGVALVFWATRDDAAAPADREPTPTTAADDDRPEPSEPHELPNEVYRAWWEMARRTEIPHTASRSPGEFAAAAVDAGMNPAAVAELTRLFRGVRYGGTAVTDDAERRATAAIDRIRSPADDHERGETRP